MVQIKKLSNILSGPALLHYVLPLLMVYLVIGTVAQKYVGLYEATRLFFSSVIFFAGGIPLPGFPILLGLIFVNLSFKLVFRSPWRLESSGIIITHIGALLLLLGGLFTALFSNEGYMDLTVGGGKSVVSDYHQREFVLLDKQGEVIFSVDPYQISEGQSFHIETLGLDLKFLEVCRNCKISAREDATEFHTGMAEHMMLGADGLRHNDEENMAGVTFDVSGAGQRYVYVSLEDVPQYPVVYVEDEEYHFALRKAQRFLPLRQTSKNFKSKPSVSI